MKLVKTFELFNQPLNESKNKSKAPKKSFSIQFTSPEVFDAVAALSAEEKKKFFDDIEKAKVDGTPVELRMDGKMVKFKRKLK